MAHQPTLRRDQLLPCASGHKEGADRCARARRAGAHMEGWPLNEHRMVKKKAVHTTALLLLERLLDPCRAD